ncbi:nuclear receptor 2C2-associated protein-like isoform X2 [Pomacea canaliculata]|uniref:nuclear receptor 2C2-associated protein-like isoform X2 n=1 Tax=Pomacea canaliculata TaxID=400727 RepID=UPI000D734AF8|nr:nuclear receptor 2C2-associated protein-like isoform X2 [Pomacea canaliculata]
MAASLVPHIRRARVSSVLNRDVKQFGKQHLFDEQEETCWNSDQGSPQFIQVNLDQPAQVTEVQIQFQGGFVGKECQLEVKNTVDNKSKICNFYPNDINSLQRFPVDCLPVADNLKIVFNTSTDLFGRVIVYKLDVIGTLM